MSELNLELSLDTSSASAAVVSARHRRAMVSGIVGGGARLDDRRTMARATRSPSPTSAAEQRCIDAARRSTRDASAVSSDAPSVAAEQPGAAKAGTMQLQLDDALVVPAGAVLRGYLRARALLLAGDIVGNVHCTAGPVVIRAGATLKGRLVASGDVYVCGRVVDSGGGAVISTRGKLTLAPGARVEGDVRSGRLDIYDGAMLQGLARAYED